jgi:dTDP-4-dehydrorhamnose reductase
MKPEILLTGVNGQVGHELSVFLPQVGSLTSLTREQLDLSKPDEIRRVVRAVKPYLIVNPAAYTAVDKAESDEQTARDINARAPEVFAEEAKRIGALLVHFSTDYVFDGTKKSAYGEDDPTNPQNAYGRTKLEGERAIQGSGAAYLIFRTAWVYSSRGRNFLLTILRLATQREELKIVNDQVGAPTSSHEIARTTAKILGGIYSGDRNPPSLPHVSGVYHMTAGGETTWYEFATSILDRAAKADRALPWFATATNKSPLIARRVLPIPTKEYPTPARRPAYSVLSNAKLGRTFHLQLPHWQSQLDSVFSHGPEFHSRGTV